MKNVLIVNSTEGNRNVLTVLYEELKNDGYNFFSPGVWINFGKIEPNWRSQIIFILCLPFYYVYSLLFVIFSFYQQKINLIICYNLPEKLLLTPLAPIFNLQIVWLEWPNEDYKKINRFLLWMYCRQASRSRIVAFSTETKKRLQDIGLSEEAVAVIPPGVKTKNWQYQENIYSSLAQRDRSDFRRKFLTIGTISNFMGEQNIETILQAVKNAVPVAPNLQFIAIGDGPERKSMTWLARRMKIDSMVWFVGEQKNLHKWLESLDLFIVCAKKVELQDFIDVLEAMSAGLPVIGPVQSELDDIICENKTGALMEMDNCEMLSQQFIKLQQEKKWRTSMGEMGKERVAAYFSFDKMVEKFKEIL